MRRLILVLFIIIQLMFFINFLLNTEVLFGNIFIWLVLSIISLVIGYFSINSEANLEENMLAHKIISYVLLIASALAIVIMIYIFIFRNYLVF